MKAFLTSLLTDTVRELQSSGQWPVFRTPDLEVAPPKNETFGDYTTNAALVLARLVKQKPMDVAGILLDALRTKSEVVAVCTIEATPPGHINFRIKNEALQENVTAILERGSRYGDGDFGRGHAVNDEFISANPTGPLHLGNCRGGFYGDSLARILRKSGFDVVSEYYVNDGGEQVMKLGHSVLKDSEAVYGGEYIETLHAELQSLDIEKTPRAVGMWAADQVLERHIKPTVEERMRIAFDSWISERRDILEKGLADKAIALLKDKGLTKEQEGALWLRTTDFGDDKDRVLVKSDGSKTYFASDCGYILHKMERGFDRLVEVFGADHHGYIGRFRAAAEALGFTGEIHFFVMQLVRLMKDGEEVRMSKRAGNVVAADDLVEAVGHDVARFFFLMYSPDTHMNFDMGLATERSQKNPVFYVQYAHARLSNVLAKASPELLEASPDTTLLSHDKELQLLRELFAFPEVVESAAREYAPHRLPQYAIRLSDRLHAFYDACRIADAEDMKLAAARLALAKATRIVLAETLRLIGVSAPEKM